MTKLMIERGILLGERNWVSKAGKAFTSYRVIDASDGSDFEFSYDGRIEVEKLTPYKFVLDLAIKRVGMSTTLTAHQVSIQKL